MVNREDGCFVFLVRFCVGLATVFIEGVFLVGYFTELEVVWDRECGFCAFSAIVVSVI